MQKQPFIVGSLVALSLALSACGAPQTQTQSAPQRVVETVVVTVEVPVTTTPAPAAPAAAATPVPAAGAAGFGETLKAIQARGKLVCGVNGQLPGFSFIDPQGNWSGFDADFCRVLAAAIFGDATKVEFRPLTTQERFTALQSGEVDVLIRNTTWTLVRDTDLGLNFTAVSFYDGQGIMVRKDSGITKLEDLKGATICVQKGTTTELNLADALSTAGVEYTPATFEDINQTYGAYAQGRCDAVTSDKSQLSSAAKAVLSDPDNHVIMDLTLSKEPLGPVVRHGDDQWLDIVRWSVFATFFAEEKAITSANVDDVKANTTNPEIKRFLGVEGELGQKLGLSNDWAYNLVKQVGNYAEIYDRNLGPNTKTYIARNQNSLYTNGGLLYSPPFR